MGLKLEHIFIISIVMILVVSFNVELTNNASIEKNSTKELEFTHTTFIEVDTNMTLSRAYSKYGIRDNVVLTLHELQFYTANIRSLTAKRGTYKENKIYLDDDVHLDQKEGFDYYAEHAVYDKKSQILAITSKYSAIMNKNIIKGDALEYDMQKKEAIGKRVDAVIYTAEK